MTLDAGQLGAMLSVMLVLSLIPGPADALIVAHAMRADARSAGALVAGIVAGDAVLLGAALAGHAGIAAAPAWLASATALVCAAFLVTAGARTLRARGVPVRQAAPASPAALSAAGTGFATTIGDPTALLFYFGALPLFLDPARATPLDALVIVAAAAAVIAAVKTLYAAAGERAAALIGRARTAAAARLATGGLLLGIGAALMLRTVCTI